MEIKELFDFCKEAKNFEDWKPLSNFSNKFVSDVYDYASLKGSYTKPGVYLMDDWYMFYTSGLTKYLNNSTANLVREIRSILLKEKNVSIENFMKTEIILYKVNTKQKVVITKLSDLGTAQEKARILKERTYPNLINGKTFDYSNNNRNSRPNITPISNTNIVSRLDIDVIRDRLNQVQMKKSPSFSNNQQARLTEIIERYMSEFSNSDSFIL